MGKKYVRRGKKKEGKKKERKKERTRSAFVLFLRSVFLSSRANSSTTDAAFRRPLSLSPSLSPSRSLSVGPPRVASSECIESVVELR